MSEQLTYAPVGATDIAEPVWGATAPGLRRFERTVTIGQGMELWERASDELLRWGVKRRSGFRITPLDSSDTRVTVDAHFRISVGTKPFVIHEPVRVVAVVNTPTRRGVAYGTLPGHPVSGEEAFLLHRSPTNTVHFTLRSLTQPAPNGPWRPLFPALLIAQHLYRHRYLRALH
ncbi:DUF1990 family protein [Nocardia sp. NPDC004722]